MSIDRIIAFKRNANNTLNPMNFKRSKSVRWLKRLENEMRSMVEPSINNPENINKINGNVILAIVILSPNIKNAKAPEAVKLLKLIEITFVIIMLAIKSNPSPRKRMILA